MHETETERIFPMKTIILTGGGTAGHVTPNIALFDALKERGYDIHYVGSYSGIERELTEPCGITYHGISSGKLRRYLSAKNFTDAFRVVKGFFEANKLVRRLKPDVIFSKGGFVSVPVALAGKLNRVPVIIHESDMTPGLANKLAFSSARRICCNFPETIEHIPRKKAVLTGLPIRAELFRGSKDTGRRLCGFNDDKPVILVIGGSQGSAAINEAIRNILPDLLGDFNIVHLCGKGKKADELCETSGYAQFEYAAEDMKDLLALADIVVSRAGANAICELLALKKPNLLIPLTRNASRGDQILNADSFKRRGFSMVLYEEDITDDTLKDAIGSLYKRRGDYIAAMSEAKSPDAVQTIVSLIEEVSA